MRNAFVLFAVLVCSNLHAQNKNDVTFRPPTPPTDVNVLNFPEVQAVEGTVSVGNLPLDVDGALRVTSAPARQIVWYELLSEPTDIGGNVLLPPEFNADGYSRIGVLARSNGPVFVEVAWDWGDGEFFSVADASNGVLDTNGTAQHCAGRAGARLVCPNTGGNVRVLLFSSVLANVTSVRLFLIP